MEMNKQTHLPQQGKLCFVERPLVIIFKSPLDN